MNDMIFEPLQIPRLKTDVLACSTDQDVDALIEDFTQQFSKQDLYEAAENYILRNYPGFSIEDFRKQDRDYGGGDGLMAIIISLLVRHPVGGLGSRADFDLLELVVCRLMQHYGFTAESAPPRLLLRDALVHIAHGSSLLADFSREQSFGDMQKLIESASKLSPEEVHRLSNEEVDNILRERWGV